MPGVAVRIKSNDAYKLPSIVSTFIDADKSEDEIFILVFKAVSHIFSYNI